LVYDKVILRREIFEEVILETGKNRPIFNRNDVYFNILNLVGW